MSASPIKVGFVGLSQKGWGAAVLAPSLLLPPVSHKYTLTAVSTTNEASADISAKRQTDIVGHVVKPYHGDTSRIASDPGVDFVVVAVGVQGQKAAALPAIAAGKDIFVEWPVGNGLKEANEIASAARKRGVRTMIGLQDRQSPVVKKLKEIVNSGKIGKIMSTSIIALVPRELNFCAPQLKESHAYMADGTGGATMQIVALGHQLDVVTHVLGDLASVSATTTMHYPTATLCGEDGKPTDKTISVTTPDHIAFTGMFKSGALASVTWRGGYKSTKGRKQLIWEIDGEEGSIRIEDDAIGSAFFFMHSPKLYLNGELVEVESKVKPIIGNLVGAWEEFAKGEKGQHATLEDAFRIHTVLDAIQRSANEGIKVTL